MTHRDFDWRAWTREHPGAQRTDITPLLGDGAVLAAAVEALSEPWRGAGVTRVVALATMGVPLGAGIALSLGTGLVLVRKAGLIPWPALKRACRDYTGTDKVLEVASDALGPGDRALLVDDWSETGAQLTAATALVEELGAEVLGFSLLHADEPARSHPRLRRHTFVTLF